MEPSTTTSCRRRRKCGALAPGSYAYARGIRSRSASMRRIGISARWNARSPKAARSSSRPTPANANAAARLDGRLLRLHARSVGQRARRRALRATAADDRARLRPDQAQPRHGPLPPTRQRRRQSRMAAHHGDAQLAQASPPRSRGHLTARPAFTCHAARETHPVRRARTGSGLRLTRQPHAIAGVRATPVGAPANRLYE
jgi:hypothetical protein